MQRKFFAIALMLLAMVMLLTTSVAAIESSASELPSRAMIGEKEEEIVPYWNNTNTCTFNFAVLDPGTAYVEAIYSAKAEAFTQAKLTVKIQKRFLGVFWKTVDIGLTDDEWISYCYDRNGEFYNSFAADGTGTYRAVFALEISGTGGETDVIERTIEYKYD
ncbi:MAG: hypothetical protein IKA46_06910 [Clostridia bacterium]|nr:hypothetical protein [Clostridia bacterium]